MVGLIAVMVVLVISGVFIILNGNKTRQEREAQQSKLFTKMYSFLSRNFITQRYMHTIYFKLANLSVYRRKELQVLSVKYFLFSWGSSLVMILVGFYMFQDFVTILLCVLFSVVLCTIVVDKQIDKTHLKVIKALTNFLSSVRQEYMKSNSVVEALSDAQCEDILMKPVEEINSMLISNNPELKLQEFNASTPFRTIQTLAGVCVHINNQGDEWDQHGQSSFIQALTLMISDVNAEIEKITFRQKRFGMIEYITLLPVVGMGAIESYFESIMPGTALIYNGMIGYIFRALTVLLAIVSYLVITRANSNVPVKEDDRGSFVVTALERPAVCRFINNIKPKGMKKYRLERSLRDAISKMTIEQFYLKKVMGGVIGFVFAIVTIMSSIQLGKDFVQNSTQDLSLVASTALDGYTREQILNLDNAYMENHAEYERIDQIVTLVQSHLSGISDLDAHDQAKRLQNKKRSLDNLYFKWWYILVAFGIGVIGWFSPEINLKVRRMMILTEEEDDFLQLQTLVSILMNTNIDTLDLLYELSQHSRVHKDMFLYAYQGYASNPELEITRLQSKTPLTDFKRFISKMKLSISDLSIKEAYSDLLIEREHILRVRDMTLKASINQRRMWCGIMSVLPLGSMVIGSFLIPIGVLGYHEFMGALQM